MTSVEDPGGNPGWAMARHTQRFMLGERGAGAETNDAVAGGLEHDVGEATPDTLRRHLAKSHCRARHKGRN